MKPQEIESLSFRIIDEEAGSHGFKEQEWNVVRRMIHTTADFEWITMVRFHSKAIAAGIAALKAGKPIITDTQMARMGIRKKDIEANGGKVECFMTDPQVAKAALAKGVTRAKEAINMAADRYSGGIYVVGNAPTALLQLIELMEKGQVAPDLIVGLPVGFVNAAESKALLMEKSNVPYITNQGRKGGSAIAASVINALIILATES